MTAFISGMPFISDMAARTPRARRWLIALLASATLPLSASGNDFWQYDHTFVQTSLATQHFSGSSGYNEDQNLIGIELHNPDRWLAGTAWLKNSFNQPIWYFYAGREFAFWQPAPNLEFRAKLTAGALRGYKGSKKHKIPFNHYGVAPAVLPAVGVRWGKVETDMLLFGTAGVMLNAGIRI
ncbi:hypothetical protein GCM10022228_13240 [Halomonas cibimaris]|uniref:Sn-glycerol-3-phosphate transporter n=2 Tax=Halomonas cibimaris TaxID=657012 RepID=A0ABP7LS53_9GAMM